MEPDVPPGPLKDAARPAAVPPRGSRWREYLEVILVAVVFALFVRTFLLQAFVVPTPSMEPTVLVGDHLVINKFVFAPHLSWPLSRLMPYREILRGDVFVFKFPEDPQRDFIKRVVAVGGDVLAIRDKEVWVNGTRRDEPTVVHEEARTWPDDPQLPDGLRRRDQLAPTVLPPETYFAMGDNRDSSYDSRFWGPVPASSVKGHALFVYWSFPTPEEGGGIGGWLRRSILGTRWSRTMRPVR
jgi:signal peptidase I